MDENVLEIYIRDEDPLFDRAQELANEVVAALAYLIVEPLGDGTCTVPAVGDVATEINRHPDMTLLGMFVFALGKSAKNMATALARERDCTIEEILGEFLAKPAH
jgi:hypothetical protein